MTPSEDIKINVIGELKKVLSDLPSSSPAEYAHGDWAEAVTLAVPSRVLSTFTLAELTRALAEDTVIELKYVSHYAPFIIGAYKWDSPEEERSEFLIPSAGDGNTAVFVIQEVVETIKVKLSEIIRRTTPTYYSNKPAPSGEYWTATLVERGTSSRNYNAPDHEWQREVVIHCDGDVITWGARKK